MSLPDDLFAARLGLLSALGALVRHARTLAPGPARDAIHDAIRGVLDTIRRLYPPARVATASSVALDALDARPRALAALDGAALEAYAAALVPALFVLEDVAPSPDETG